MLYQTVSQATDGAATRQCPSRCIDDILARREARIRRRKHVFPPDFMHGRKRVDCVYRTLGERWVEEALFVERFFDEEGRLAGFTAAWFDGRFLTLEQAVRDEVDDLDARLAELEAGRRSIVELRVDQTRAPGDDASRIELSCSLGRLLELERERLAVVRDKELSQPTAIYSQRDEVLQDSRTNILSLICLCGELGA